MTTNVAWYDDGAGNPLCEEDAAQQGINMTKAAGFIGPDDIDMQCAVCGESIGEKGGAYDDEEL